MTSKKLFYSGIAILPLLSNAADFANLDFAFDHGTVITNQYAAQGITISASSDPTNVAIVYDSELRDINGLEIDGADDDLERIRVGSTGWEGGNLGANHVAGGVLVIQENNPDPGVDPTTPTQFVGNTGELFQSASGYNPDDDALPSGGGGGGIFTFEIDEANFTYNFFKVNLADFEEDGQNYVARLFGVDGGFREVFFNTFTLPYLTIGGDPSNDPADSSRPNPDFDPSITSGDHHINTLPQIAIFNDPSVEALDRVEIELIGSSGSISNIIFSETPIPEPSSSLLIAVGGLFLLRRKR